MTLLLTTRIEYVSASPICRVLFVLTHVSLVECLKRADQKSIDIKKFIFITKCDRGGGVKHLNVIVTLRYAKVVWKCPPRHNKALHTRADWNGTTPYSGRCVSTTRPHSISFKEETSIARVSGCGSKCIRIASTRVIADYSIADGGQ